MADSTYGFGGSEPARNVGAARSGDTVKSSTADDTAPCWYPLDDDHTGNIRGVSPVSGLEATPGWETSGPKSGGTVSSATGTGNTLAGSWPIQGSALNPPVSRPLGGGDTDWKGGDVGDGDVDSAGSDY